MAYGRYKRNARKKSKKVIRKRNCTIVIIPKRRKSKMMKWRS